MQRRHILAPVAALHLSQVRTASLCVARHVGTGGGERFDLEDAGGVARPETEDDVVVVGSATGVEVARAKRKRKHTSLAMVTYTNWLIVGRRYDSEQSSGSRSLLRGCLDFHPWLRSGMVLYPCVIAFALEPELVR